MHDSPHVAPAGAGHPARYDYSGTVRRRLSADQPVRGMNRASLDWGKRRQPLVRDSWSRHREPAPRGSGAGWAAAVDSRGGCAAK
jgi:hypothetical protein